MGEFEITGPDRNAFVNRVTCNDVGKLEPGEVQYSAILTPRRHHRGRLHRLPVRRQADDRGQRVERARDWEHIVEQKGGVNVRLKDISDEVGLLALQGPEGRRRCSSRSPTPSSPTSRTTISSRARWPASQCIISRTGYTGEDGFELYCRDRDAVVWDALIGAGAKPIGLGARDTLRLEMGYALYGNDIDETTTPLEAGLGWIVKLDKGRPSSATRRSGRRSTAA